jgi:4-hydroxy-3-methylbut-2-enyl diphosphate reductase
VVLKLQRDIAAAWRTVSAIGGSVVIFGKRGHAEVNGLVGQTRGEAIVIENTGEIGSLDFSHHIELFSQTTRDPGEYVALKEALLQHTSDVTIHDTICRQVSSRHRSLAAFAAGHDVILFVSGRDSSNGKVLFELCRKHNPNTHWVEDPASLRPEWLTGARTIGITGATSTPRWQLEAVAAMIR